MYNRHIRHLILLCLSLHRLEIRDGERAQLRFLIRIRTLQFEPLVSANNALVVGSTPPRPVLAFWNYYYRKMLLLCYRI